MEHDELDQLGRLTMNQLTLDEMNFDLSPYIAQDEEDDSESEDEDITAYLKREAMRGMGILKTMNVDEVDKKHKGPVTFDERTNQYRYYNQSN